MRVLIFFGNILKNLVVVYVATLAEVPSLDLAFSCKMMRKWYFWYCSSFFVHCIYLDHGDTMLMQIHFPPLCAIKNLATLVTMAAEYLSSCNSTTIRNLNDRDVLPCSTWCAQHNNTLFRVIALPGY